MRKLEGQDGHGADEVAASGAGALRTPRQSSERADVSEARRLERQRGVEAWLGARSFPYRFELPDLLALKRATISVVLPALNVAETIGSVLDSLGSLRSAGLLDEILLVDAASSDGTAEVAAAWDVSVHQESELMAEFGPAKGKGDAMWRGIAASRGDIVVFVDTDTRDFEERFVLGLLGPLLEEPEIHLVKGSFRRPFQTSDELAQDDGGRVTELLARPFLNLYFPELAGFAQPLAGEIAARRPLFEALSFPVGYGVEIAMLIDAMRLAGIDALAQVELGSRQNRHQPLLDLGAMAYSILVAASSRVYGREAIDAYGPGFLALPDETGIDLRAVALEERPPLSSLPRPR